MATALAAGCQRLRTVADVGEATYEAEVRQWHEGYLLVVKGPYLNRCIGVPKVMRSGRPGLEVVLEEIEFAIEEVCDGH